MTIFCLELAVFSKPLPTFEELGNEATHRTLWTVAFTFSQITHTYTLSLEHFLCQQALTVDTCVLGSRPLFKEKTVRRCR